jgi:sugar phosphate isomerase/epimerase
MTADGIFHTQFNLSNAGLPTLPETIEEKKIEEIKNLTKKYNITLDALSGTFNMIDPDEEARKKGCEQFGLQCRIARLLDIPIVSLCTGSKNPRSKWEWHEDNEKQSSWDDLMRSTEVIVKYAEENHVILGVETEASNIINTPQKARKYIEATGSSNIKIIMDGANLFRPQQVHDMKNVLKEAFEILGKDIVLAHAKDFSFDKTLAFTAAGNGVLDFKYYIGLLKQYGYEGALVMHGLSAEQVPNSKNFLEEILKNG